MLRSHQSDILTPCYLFVGYSDISFLATFDVFLPPITNPLVFDYPVLNPGGHYDPTTGIFTVPIDGDYELIVQVLGDDDAEMLIYLSLDGTDVSILVTKQINEQKGLNCTSGIVCVA